MEIIITGLNHKSSDIIHREEVSKKILTKELRNEFIFNIKRLFNEETGKQLIQESAIISTCNRAEFIFAVSGNSSGGNKNTDYVLVIKNIIIKYLFGDNFGNEELQNMFYTYKNFEAILHFFKVASSLDSMVIGEPQILGQIKESYNEACEFKNTGLILNKLFHKSFYCAKRVRTETKIAAAPVSISYAAVELAKKIFNDISNKKVLLLGTGEMGKIAAKHFIKQGVSEIFITNRTREKAVKLAEELDGYYSKTIVDFNEYYKILTVADIVLCSTGADSYIIKYEDILPIIKMRKQRPIFLIDISVPRNIDPEINKISNVYLFDIDDIGKIIENNLDVRQQEADFAEKIIDEEAEDFINWKNSLNAVPIIVNLRNKVNGILSAELCKYINNKDEDIEAIVNSITNKILHEPITKIKRSEVDFNGLNLMEAAKILFDLEINLNSVSQENKEVEKEILNAEDDYGADGAHANNANNDHYYNNKIIQLNNNKAK
jgi:glutamyl-tRNA reductase